MDMERLASLYQKRYNITNELNRITDELLVSSERQDNVSMDLLLDMREECIHNLEQNEMEVREMVEVSELEAKIYQKITGIGEKERSSLKYPEKQVAELYLKVGEVLEEVKKKNKLMLFRANRSKDYLADKILA
ncbi:hypothetical protein [Oribacterium parvum]|jgi:hypothetical protein|uniref:hypothetical protein n=1 Tax=Oribacterium parvum TaxID=1501329 RepID=UPI0028DB0B10|nr:hypothetical protein [Oribacterium parvum]